MEGCSSTSSGGLSGEKGSRVSELNDEELYGKPVFYDSKEMYDMAKLTIGARDDLLIRMDERQQLLIKSNEKDHDEIKQHIIAINGRTRKNENRSKVNQATIALIIGGAGIFLGIQIW